MKRKIPELDPPIRKYRPVTEPEKQVWRSAVGGELATSKVEPEPVLPSKKSVSAPLLKKKPVKPVKVNPLDKETLAKIRRRLVAIESTFDMHGYTRETGFLALMQFIRQAQGRGVRTVLIITGKGRGEKDGVLRAMLPIWLGETALRDYVMAYDTAQIKHGGSGAWYVRLRKRASHS